MMVQTVVNLLYNVFFVSVCVWGGGISFYYYYSSIKGYHFLLVTVQLISMHDLSMFEGDGLSFV